MSKKSIVILLSDKDPFLLKVYKHKFQKLDWEVHEADTPVELKELVLKEKPDIILTDIILKDGNAYDVLEEIKKHKDKEIAGTRIIILTNLKQESDRKKMKEFGATEHLIKTEVSFEDVVKKIKEIAGTV